VTGKFLTYQDDTDKAQLEMLNRYFKTTPSEKHPKAMLSMMFEQTFNKVLGENFCKKRVGERKAERYYAVLLKRLQGCYGKYINVTNFRIKRVTNSYQLHFGTNFSRVYKTEFGLLYGAPYTGLWEKIFYTYHCFQRFDERCPEIYRKVAAIKIAQNIKTKPTTADIVMTLTMLCRGTFQYAKVNNFYYLNIGPGALVLEGYKEFLIVKTFLMPEMVDKNLKWLQPTLKPEYYRKPSQYFCDIRDLFIFDPFSISGPDFWIDISDKIEVSEDMVEP